VSRPRLAPVWASDVSVIICCYTEDRWDDVIAAVQSARQQQPPPCEVVLVVDHNERLLQRLTDALTGAVIVANDEVQGLAGARNTGVRAAVGSVLAFLDDDARAEPGWLAALVEAYGPEVLGVGGRVDADWPGSRPTWFPEEFDWVVGCSYRGMPGERSAVRNFIGANMSLRREAFEAVGGFSHSLGRVGKHPAGCEETELCIRAGRAFPGTSMTYQPAARVRHRVTPERTTWGYFRRRCYAEGVSKAIVAGLSGSDAALATERTYVLRVLPAGVARGLTRPGRGGLGASLVIVAGACITALGYVRGTRAR
jgi:GT2 family glycosyltransferase